MGIEDVQCIRRSPNSVSTIGPTVVGAGESISRMKALRWLEYGTFKMVLQIQYFIRAPIYLSLKRN